MIPYLFHVSILMAGGYIFYWLFLRQETFFQLNRGVLLACLLLPLVLPLVPVPAAWSFRMQENIMVNKQGTVDQKTVDQKTENSLSGTITHKQKSPDLIVSNITSEVEEIAKTNRLFSISSYDLFYYCYLTGVFIFALSFFVQLLLVLAKKNTLHTMQDGKYKIVELIKDEAPYSFWNTIFINPAAYNPETYEQILAHEKIHIDQTHFIDKILAELLLIVFWFNPFAWLFRKVIANNLEFLTDQTMLSKGFAKQSYQMSLLQVSVKQHPLNLTTNYNQSFLKNRIAMMNTKKSSASSIWKYLFILPLLGFSMLSLNAIAPESKPTTPVSETSIITEVIPNAEIIETIPNAETIETIPNAEIIKTTTENELKEEVLRNLRQDNLLSEDAPVFKLFPNKVLLNEEPLAESLRKKYLSIFKKYNITPQDSRLMVIKPLVIMSGTFIGVETEKTGTHIDVLNEEEDMSQHKNVIRNRNRNKHITNTNKHKNVTNKQSSSHHKNGSVSVEFINGKTYIQGEGTHNINGQNIVNKAGQTTIIEKDGTIRVFSDDDLPTRSSDPTYYEQDNEELTGLEKHYWESSKEKGHLHWVGRSATRLDKAGSEYWQLPQFCEALTSKLVRDGFVQKGTPILMYTGARQLYVNGQIISGSAYEQYAALGTDHQIPLSKGWNLEYDGKSVLIIAEIKDVDELRLDLLAALVKDNFISNKSQEVLLQISGPEMRVNKRTIPRDKLTTYYHILHRHDVIPAPGKIIHMNEKKISIHVGYKKDTTFLGTFTME